MKGEGEKKRKDAGLRYDNSQQMKILASKNTGDREPEPHVTLTIEKIWIRLRKCGRMWGSKTPGDGRGQKLERSENKSRYLETRRQRVRKLERPGTWEGVGMSCLRERGRINRGSWDTRWLGIMPTWPGPKIQWLSKYCHSHTLYNISTLNFPVIKDAFIYTFLYFPGTNTEKN